MIFWHFCKVFCPRSEGPPLNPLPNCDVFLRAPLHPVSFLDRRAKTEKSNTSYDICLQCLLLFNPFPDDEYYTLPN